MFIRRRQIQEMQGAIDRHNDIIDAQSRRIQRLQEYSDDILSGETFNSPYSGNRYIALDQAIQAIDKKYNCEADWGCQQTANIIDFRAAMIAGEGLKIASDDKKMMDFVDQMIDENNLDYEGIQDNTIDGEIEGRFLMILSWDIVKKMVIATPISWLETKYTVTTNPLDRKEFETVWWLDANGGRIEHQAPFFVYKKFGGRQSKPNQAIPKLNRCLTQVENIDQAFRDLREINRLFAGPTPTFECNSPEAAADMNDALQNKNWRIKKAIAVHGQFRMVGPDMAGVDALEKEIVRLACFISGSTGYPLQFLLPDYLSNRSTAENIMESAVAHTAREREVWLGFYRELIEKSMDLAQSNNPKLSIKYDPDLVKVTLPKITTEQWSRLTTFWLPAVRDGQVRRELFLSQIPGIDAQAEISAMEAEDEEQQQKIVAELENELNKKDDEMNNGGNNADPRGKNPNFGRRSAGEDKKGKGKT